jgi:HEAT repeat protein
MSRVLPVREAFIVPVPAVPPRVERLLVDRRSPSVRVFITAWALQRVWETVAVRDAFVERGGHLVGHYCVDARQRRFTIITDALPALGAPATGTRIQIRPEDWVDVHHQLARMPGIRVLGWYHSHPGDWVGMSSIDRNTQRCQFNVDWQVGLVVSPSTGRFRFHQGADARRAPWVAIAARQHPAAPTVISRGTMSEEEPMSARDGVVRRVADAVARLGRPHPLARRLGALVLGALHAHAEARDAVPILRATLGDDDCRVRVQAAEAVGLMEDSPRAVATLIAAVAGADPDCRLHAIQALGYLGPWASAAGPVLVAALGSEDAAVRLATVQALRTIRAPAESAAAALLETLVDGEDGGREAARDALTALGRSAVPFLVRALLDERPIVRHEALRALRRIGWVPSHLVDALVDSFRYGDTWAWGGGLIVRLFALDPRVEALTWVEAPEVALAGVLRGPEVEVRRLAVRALDALAARRLARVRPGTDGAGNDVVAPAAADVVLDRLHSANVYVCKDREIFNGRFALGDLRAVWPPLVEVAAASARRDPSLRAMLATSIERPGATVNAYRAYWAVSHRAHSLLPPLIEEVRSGTWPGTVAAMELLAHIGPRAAAAVPALGARLADSYWLYRWYAAQALGHIGPRALKALPALVRTLGDPEARVREAAAAALGEIRPASARAIPALVEMLSNDYARTRIVRALMAGDAELDLYLEALRRRVTRDA